MTSKTIKGARLMNLRLVATIVGLAVSVLLSAIPAPALAGKTQNVVLVVGDGLRWQEIFTGADPTLLNDKEGGSWTPIPALRKLYWNDDLKQRRQLLFPFLWGTVAREGQLLGNQTEGSIVRVTNPMWFSYPGYNEMASGVADPK